MLAHVSLDVNPVSCFFENCIRKLPRASVKPDLGDARTSPHSFTPMTSLQNEELLRRCRRMSEYIVKLKRSHSKLLKLYEHETKKENLMKMPHNVFLTSGKLSTLIELALSKKPASRKFSPICIVMWYSYLSDESRSWGQRSNWAWKENVPKRNEISSNCVKVVCRTGRKMWPGWLQPGIATGNPRHHIELFHEKI